MWEYSSITQEIEGRRPTRQSLIDKVEFTRARRIFPCIDGAGSAYIPPLWGGSPSPSSSSPASPTSLPPLLHARRRRRSVSSPRTHRRGRIRWCNARCTRRPGFHGPRRTIPTGDPRPNKRCGGEAATWLPRAAATPAGKGVPRSDGGRITEGRGGHASSAIEYTLFVT